MGWTSTNLQLGGAIIHCGSWSRQRRMDHLFPSLLSMPRALWSLEAWHKALGGSGVDCVKQTSSWAEHQKGGCKSEDVSWNGKNQNIYKIQHFGVSYHQFQLFRFSPKYRLRWPSRIVVLSDQRSLFAQARCLLLYTPWTNRGFQ